MAPSTFDRKRRRPATEDTDGVSNGDSVKKAKVDDQRSSIFVRSLPPSATNETLADFFSHYFPVKHAVVVADQKTKESRGFGFVTFADANDAKEAQKALDKKDWDGRRLRVDIAEPRHRKAASGEAPPPKRAEASDAFPKPPKLIVRNLPWSIKTPDQLAKLFTSFGKVKFADLPQDKGKLKGFGFVTLRGKPNAEKALEAINGKVVDGRTLAVDWAVDKGTWEQQQAKDEKNDKAIDVVEEEESEEEDEDEISVSDINASANVKGDEPKNRDAQLDADLANFMKNFMQNMEDEDDEDEDKKDDENEGVDDDEENLDFELDENEEEANASTQPKRELTRDNSLTVFVRNLPFATTDEQLKSFFGHFGKIRYARVVMDKVTEKPAGTGFVCFFDKADVKACLVGAPSRAQQTTGLKNSILQDENADPTGKYTMDGRVLQVVQAVGKEEAGSLAENSLAKRREKDKRRLFLLAEGAIGQSSPLYRLLSPVEIRMRQASAAQRKKLVQKNPLLHISLTRLALRNIPRNIGAKELKELARKAVVGFAEDVRAGRRQPLSKEENARDGKDAKEKERERKLKKKGIVRQAKIVFEDNKGSKVSETSGAGKSRGYGFIEYASHHWALMGLRYLNGHPLDSGEGGKKQRLIAEFAIENAQVVQRRRAAEERAAKPTAAAQNSNEDEDEEEDEEHEPEARPKGKHARHRPEKEKMKGKQQSAGKKSQAEADAPKPADAKDDMHKKLIARRMSMRRKKAAARGKK